MTLLTQFYGGRDMRTATALDDVIYNGAISTICKVEETKKFFGRTRVKVLGYSFGIDYPEGVRVSDFYETEQECRKEALRELIFVEDHYKNYYESQLYKRA